MTNTGAIGDETVRYFQRLSGFDSLRIVLADKLVLVEGPSDEMVFERAFMQKHNEAPLDRGIDIVSTFGIALSRPLELCSALGRHAAALRDNDGKAILHWTQRFEAFLENGKREIFVGDPEQGSTLEPQLVAVNDDKALREVLVVKREEVTPCEWMKQNKTEAALRLLEAPDSFVLQVPDYITRAIEFIE